MKKALIVIGLLVTLLQKAHAANQLELPMTLGSGTTFSLYCPAGGLAPQGKPTDVTYQVTCAGNMDVFAYKHCKVSKKVDEKSFEEIFSVVITRRYSESQYSAKMRKVETTKLTTTSVQEAMKLAVSLLEKGSCD